MTVLARLSAPGSTAAYDDLVEAVQAFSGTPASLRHLNAVALNCGMPADTADVVAWAEIARRSALASEASNLAIAAE